MRRRHDINSLGSSDISVLPKHRDLYYGGGWHSAGGGAHFSTYSPSTGEDLGDIAEAGSQDIESVVAAARRGFAAWRIVSPRARAAVLREVAGRIRTEKDDLALIDAIDGGNPVCATQRDITGAVEMVDYFAGLVTEIKGTTIPMGVDVVNYTLREPLGVVARIIPSNHPAMFTLIKMAAPLAAGNSIIIKPSEQTSLSALRIAELIGVLFPPGVVNVVTGCSVAGAALAAHPGIAKVGLVGSVPTGREVMRAAADTIKPVSLELGGKNALIAYPDADAMQVAKASVSGMNFTQSAGQSCGSTSRIFVHAAIYEATLAAILEGVRAIRMGLPTDPKSEMGCLVDQVQFDKVLDLIESGPVEGARLVAGGERPQGEAFARGYFVAPTVFVDVPPTSRIAREEIFGPVMCVFRWSDEDAMFDDVNGVAYGLTASIWTNNLAVAHRAAARVEAGYVWINGVGNHFLGAPFGGYKQSGFGRDECIEELLDFTQIKNVNVSLAV
ncbi:MAG: aldehyde dehydrogenase [Acidiferrobacteraceae bacterium]|jgi:betaine-aldehyde dehydrogenase|nr:aldehyde dehydrogenase [Acidiferrobacteraceae bacterium]